MTQVSKHFKRHEFACKCGCGFDTVDAETLAALETIRMHFNAPVIITSGCRCPAHNARVGGAANSQHVLARAADIKVRGVAPRAVADFVERSMGNVSVGRYATFTHVDTRSGRAVRWGRN